MTPPLTPPLLTAPVTARLMYFTPATVAVGLEFAREPDSEHWAYELAKSLGLTAPTVNTVLHRMHDAGWLAVRVDRQHHPARRLHRLTNLGRDSLDHVRDAASKPPPTAGPPRRRTKPQPRASTPQTGICPECFADFTLRDDGLLPGHRRCGRPCLGSWEQPAGLISGQSTEAPARRTAP